MGFSVLVHSIFGVEIPKEDFAKIFKSIFLVELLTLTDKEAFLILGTDNIRDCYNWEEYCEKYLSEIEIKGTPYKIEKYEGDSSMSLGIFIVLKKTTLQAFNMSDSPVKVLEPTAEQVWEFSKFLQERDIPYTYGNYLVAEGC